MRFSLELAMFWFFYKLNFFLKITTYVDYLIVANVPRRTHWLPLTFAKLYPHNKIFRKHNFWLALKTVLYLSVHTFLHTHWQAIQQLRVCKVVNVNQSLCYILSIGYNGCYRICFLSGQTSLKSSNIHTTFKQKLWIIAHNIRRTNKFLSTFCSTADINQQHLASFNAVKSSSPFAQYKPIIQ